MNTKYIFLDVDGTLVNFDCKIPNSAVVALKKAQENGHKVFISTGRQKSQIYPWLLERVNFDGICGCCGAYVEIEGEVIFKNHPIPEKLHALIDFFNKEKIPYVMQSANAIIAERWCYEQIVDFMIKRGNNKEFIDGIFGQVVFTDTPHTFGETEKVAYYISKYNLAQMQERFNDYYSIFTFKTSADDPVLNLHHGEICFDGVNKAVGIQKVLDFYGADVCDCIAVGDSGNDTEMLEFANIGVAMGNATNSAKKVADFVTTDIDEDGIFNAFVELGLI